MFWIDRTTGFAAKISAKKGKGVNVIVKPSKKFKKATGVGAGGVVGAGKRRRPGAAEKTKAPERRKRK